MPLLIILVSLIFIYISKKRIVSEFSRLIYRFGGGRKVIIWAWSLVFLPGTIIHEISHFFAAAATGARIGKIEIFPEDLEEAVLGYVQTQKLNPVRGFIVGLAPLISGLVVLTWLASILQTNFDSGSKLLFVLELYLFFTVVNSFFPSASDIKQTLPLFVAIGIITIVAVVLGIQLSIAPSPQILDLIESLTFALLISVIINSIVLSILFILNRLLHRRA